MSENISLAALMQISDNSKNLQRKPAKTNYRAVSDQILKPLLEALGWEMPAATVYLSHGKPSLAYDALKDVYSGQIGGQAQFVTGSITDDLSQSEITRLIQYAYNKNTAWALTVSPNSLRLYHTFMNAQRTEDSMSPLWAIKMDTLQRSLGDLSRYLSATAANNGVLCSIDKDLSAKNTVALPVTRKLFESTKSWRARMIEKFYTQPNNNLDLSEIDAEVNHVLNQIVFIRVAEDRRFGETPYLQEILNQWQESGKRAGRFWSQFEKSLDSYSKRYAVELFSKKTLIDMESVESLLIELIISLHSPGFPTVKYDFSIIDVDVLGEMYEQYLKLKPRLRVKEHTNLQPRLLGNETLTELSPSDENQGVQYTPQYIVDYIVDSTLQKWKPGKDSKSPTILDMACGSGSFLISAYKWLLAKQETEKGTNLSKEEKQSLLRTYIWGMDKDSKAVEICKLNLWLYALESRQSLPDLDLNIQAGDSLMNSSLQTNDTQLITEEQTKSIIWKNNFSEIMKNDGWDVIVGNPPYIRIQLLSSVEKESYLKNFKLIHGNFDISLAFVEMALKLIRRNGVAGFIISSSILRSVSASLVRKEIVKDKSLLAILDFGDQQVFEGVGAYTCILFLGKQITQTPRMGVVLRLAPCPAAQLARWESEDYYDDTLVSGDLEISRLGGAPWVLVPNKEYDLRKKLEEMSNSLEKLAHIFQGFKTGKDDAFIFEGEECDGENLELIDSTGRKIKIEKDICSRLIKSGEIERFRDPTGKRYVLFPYLGEQLISEDTINSKYPNCWEYLNREDVKRRLKARKSFHDGKIKWYAYSFPKSMTLYKSPKLLTPDIAPQASFAFDEKGQYCFTGGVAGDYGLTIIEPKIKYEFLMGILNSMMIDWYVQPIAAKFKGGYYSYEKRFIKDIPIKIIDGKGMEQIISIVQMLRRTYSNAASGEIKKDTQDREIASIVSKLGAELNDAVMNYYSLTPTEKDLIRLSPYWRNANYLPGRQNVATV
jgi:type I restriction-modification system DNA methylase subunit